MITKDRSMIEARNGYITIDIIGDLPSASPHSYIVRSKRDDATSLELELSYADMVEFRAMLWDAMRRQGRGTEISIEELLRIEEVRHKGRYSISGYEDEIKWTIGLLKRHLDRVADYRKADAEDRSAFGKLDEFLSELSDE